MVRRLTRRPRLRWAATDLFDATRSGFLRVDPGKIYPFDQPVAAHHDLETRRTVGFAVLKI
jgi:NADPH2:quinone reductase